MKKVTHTSFQRTEERKQLLEIVASPKAQFVYLRGRRRIGKSWLLSEIVESQPNIFYFSGAKDSRSRNTISQFAKAWYAMVPASTLQRMRPGILDWRSIFAEIILDLKNFKHPPTLVFDEIQWIAKTGSGFIGAIKEAWVQIERHNLAHIIICGSSNKFFNEHVGGEEKILRGLQTRSAIVLRPLKVAEVQKVFFPSWSEPEVALLYMLVGGIPYYLHQFSETDGFINSINKALFSNLTIFLDEVNEVLGLEFNRTGLHNVNRLLLGLATYGSSQATSRKRLRLASSTTSELFNKLVEYDIINEAKEFGRYVESDSSGRTHRYFLNDFYLNTYFSILFPLINDIEKNLGARQNIFGHRVIRSKDYYIEGFSGKAFERFFCSQLLLADVDSQLYKKLHLFDGNFQVCTYSDSSTQVDIVIRHNVDRLVRVVECKWTRNTETKWLEELVEKKMPLQTNQQRLNVIVLQGAPSKLFISRAKELKVEVVALADVFA